MRFFRRKKANGGIIKSGQLYTVGREGPEIFIPLNGNGKAIVEQLREYNRRYGPTGIQ